MKSDRVIYSHLSSIAEAIHRYCEGTEGAICIQKPKSFESDLAMARVIAASACGAVVALGLSKLLRGKAEAPVDTLKFLIRGAFFIFSSYTSTEATRKCCPLSLGRICHSLAFL